MSILDKIKQRHGIPTGKNITQQNVEGYSPIQRTNYVSLGNTVELATEIVHGLIRGNSGIWWARVCTRCFRRTSARIKRLNNDQFILAECGY